MMHKGTQFACLIAILVLLLTCGEGAQARTYEIRDFDDMLDAMNSNVEKRANCDGCDCNYSFVEGDVVICSRIDTSFNTGRRGRGVLRACGATCCPDGC